jgi:radical SAM superfamily enzyme YgiQ (UPF0313 family)
LSDIVLTTINAKWTHPSLALRLLKANLGSLENQCEIIEFALRQPLGEKVAPILEARPRVLGISVSIWNHIATIELLEELEKVWGKNFTTNQHEPTRTGEEREGREEVLTKNTKEEKNTKERGGRPIVVLGGPEVSYLADDAYIFRFADFVIRGEGESVFSALCESVFQGENEIFSAEAQSPAGSGWLAWMDARFGVAGSEIQPCVTGRALRLRAKHFFPKLQDDLTEIKTGYHLYTDEDVAQKLIYVESTRGCPFECEFCLSAVKPREQNNVVREFPLEQFLADMEILINRGVRTIKFLDRTFNANINRAVKICDFFLRKQEERGREGFAPFVVHFEMVPSLFPKELCEILMRFPADSLRLEIGVQTLNTEVSARIHRPGWRNQSINPEKELETIRFLRKNTNAIIHVDLIAGLPGEDLQSFGLGFDRLWGAVREEIKNKKEERKEKVEIQVGILKRLPGAAISRHNEAFGMRYNCRPPYEIEETSVISEGDLRRVKNFAAFWERLVNRGLLSLDSKPVFDKFMALSDALFEHFGKNWGIDKNELIKKATDIYQKFN